MAPHASVPPLSCRLEVLPGGRVIDQLQSAAHMGFDGVALPGRYLDSWLGPLRECRDDSPVAMAGISLGFRGSLLSPHSSVRTECRASLIRLLDLAAELRAGWINVPPCLTQDNPGRMTGPGGFASLQERLDGLLLEQLPELGDAALDRGVLFLIEPVNRSESDYLNSIEHAARLCARLHHPAVGCTADFFHMQLEQPNLSGALGRAGHFVRHVHLAGASRQEPGPGMLDFSSGFRALKSSGYRGWLEIECRSLSGSAAEVLPASADYLRKTWMDA
jgi:sugar phosphate isomerase/epimerase